MEEGRPESWEAVVGDYLKAKVPLLQPDWPPVAAIEPIVADVWRVVLADGRQLAAKHQLYGFLSKGRRYDLLEVEQATLAELGRAGCPVPRVLGVDRDNQFIFFSWCGDKTLEEAAQLGEVDPLVPQVVEGLCRISAVFQENCARGAARCGPAGTKDSLAQAWRAAAAAARRGLAFLAVREAVAVPLQRAERALEAMLIQIEATEPCLGTTDYNSRNIVVAGETISFIEFAKIGWDWTERRLVQYTSTMGVNGGGFDSVLSRSTAALYGRCATGDPLWRVRLLDYHQIALWLNAADRLSRALAKGDEALLKVWQRPGARLRQLSRSLSAPLSDDAIAGEFRSWFGKDEILQP